MKLVIFGGVSSSLGNGRATLWRGLCASVDHQIHRPSLPVADYPSGLSYLGTCAADRDAGLHTIFIKPAMGLPRRRFAIGCPKYDAVFPWQPSIFWLSHVPSADRAAFYCSASLTLNVTGASMASRGKCPSAGSSRRLHAGSPC
jgi:spore maturation protein CgeB